jgi:hypothetical protein
MLGLNIFHSASFETNLTQQETIHQKLKRHEASHKVDRLFILGSAADFRGSGRPYFFLTDGHLLFYTQITQK